MDDLIKRLRALSACTHDDRSIGAEAANEIERIWKLVGDYRRADTASGRNLSMELHFGLAIARLDARKALFDVYDAREGK